jgi:hypothetical protein
MKLCIHTIFWAFGEKTPSLLFMLREENLREIFSEIISQNFCILSLMKIIQALWNTLRRYKKSFVLPLQWSYDLSCAVARFSHFQNILRWSTLYPLLVPHAICCMMLMLCKNDVMMLCYAKWYLCHRYMSL